ncbi:MAG: hypothetical protein WAL50_12095 [Kineosporiaceae bacterium]
MHGVRAYLGQIIQPRDKTYPLGAFYPNPGPAAARMSIDLQLAGLIPDVPIVADATPAPVTWQVKAPEPGAVVDRHDLTARVVGGTVNEGAGVQGLVTRRCTSRPSTPVTSTGCCAPTPTGWGPVRHATSL